VDSGLRLTYAAELRSERPEKIARHYGDARTSSSARTRALATTHIGKSRRRVLAQPERARRSLALDVRLDRLPRAGKVLSFLRLLKASFTFDGGLSYLVWKIERQSGVRVEITPFIAPVSAARRHWRDVAHVAPRRILITGCATR
jgi:hypothetical protein